MIHLNYKKFGQGSPIVILHGIFGMLDNWKTFGRKLSDEFEVFLIDQRDHGRSPHTKDFNYPILADDIKDFLVFHGIGKCNFIGHSMGGKVMMEFARKYPECIDQLVVVDMGVKQYHGGHEKIIEALRSLPLNEINSRKEAEELLSLKINDKGVVLFLMKNLSRNPEGGYSWKLNIELIANSYSDLMQYDLSDADIPEVDVRFIKGGNSRYILTEDMDGIKQVFPKATFSVIENAGHWVHAEQPLELEILIRSYFNNNIK